MLPPAGVLMLAPVIGDIPGVAVMPGTLVILVASERLVGREHARLPR